MTITLPAVTFDFQKLDVYQKAKTFHIGCKGVLSNAPVDRYVRDQLKRASYSVVLNIAEGSGRITPADRRNFFTIARASIFECVAILDVMCDEGHVDLQTHHDLIKMASELSKMLFAMIRNLKG